MMLAGAALAEAQTTRVSFAPASPARWDVSGEAGWLSSNKSEIGQDWDDRYGEPTGGAALGRYWTTHLKTELRLAFSGEGRVYEEERLVVPGELFPTFRLREHHFRRTTVGGGVSYQFFENQWLHPHVGAGVEVERESHRQFAPEWRVPSRDPGPPVVVPADRGETSVTWGARPFVAAGFKWYVHERGFARSDVRVSFGGSGVSHVVWTAGIGVDL